MSSVETIDLSRILDPKASEEVVRREIAEACRIDLQALDIALSRHPGLYAYCAAVQEVSEVKEAQAKWAMEEVKAQVSMDVRRSLNGQKSTEGEIEARIKLDPRMKNAMSQYWEAMTQRGNLKALAKGLEHRRDMLVQISSRQKAFS